MASEPLTLRKSNSTLTSTLKKEAYFLRKHDFITDLLQAKLQSVIDSFKQVDWSPEPAARTEERLIWVFWWQGEDAMPDIVRMCCDFIRLRAGLGARVIVLSKDNLARHVVFPDFVMRKLDAGLITLAQFTDIVRVHLLHQHGGLWLDATVYVSQEIPDEVFAPFFTIRHQRIVKYAALGRWTGFALGGQKGGVLFAFLSAAICKYWERQHLLVDYYLLDYLINLADRRFPAAHGIIEFERVDRRRDFRIGGRFEPRARRGRASEGQGAERLSQALLEGSPALEDAGRRGYEFRGPAASAGDAQMNGPGRCARARTSARCKAGKSRRASVDPNCSRR